MEPEKTCLYDLHIAHGAKMVPFAGFSMPVQYAGQTLVEEHLWTRNHASIFDVSHMVQQNFTGPGAGTFLESVTPASVANMEIGSGKLSVLLSKDGGIVDDCLISRIGESEWYVVTNAGRRSEDGAFFKHGLERWAQGGDELEKNASVSWEIMDRGMFAFQGPESKDILAACAKLEDGRKWDEFYFGEIGRAILKLDDGMKVSVLVSRGGYTGEDGFEIGMIDPKKTGNAVEMLITQGSGKVRLAGLGARDSLRLEAGMCLYGHDLDESISPVEAALGWVIPKERRTKDYSPQFPGLETILEQIKPRSKGGRGVDRYRVGLVVEKGPPAREGAEVVFGEDLVGKVTSGCPSPSLGTNVAMGYVRHGFQKAGTELEVLVRGRRRRATVTKMPFVESRYYRKG